MNAEEFRKHGRQMVDFIADYMENIRDRPVVHRVQPGYLAVGSTVCAIDMLKELIPPDAPEKPEEFTKVFADIENVIMPGITHWHSPYFHGYVPAGSSYPSMLGDMLSNGIGCIGFTWATSPACTELEMITTDWLGKMIGLPETFLHASEGPSGGVIQHTASETVLLCLLTARKRMLTVYAQEHPEMDEGTVMSKLVAYTSDQANSSVHRSGLLVCVRMVQLPADGSFSLRGDTLREAVERDKARGYIPFFLCASLGTTGTCAFDNLEELGPVCEANNIWLHVDAAYAGNAFVCPEFRKYMKGVQFAHTFCVNPHKWMLTNHDLSVMWIQDSRHLVDAFNVDPIYLQHENEGQVPDFRHWQIPLNRRFRSLKLWCVIRSYGVEGIRKFIRKHCELAREFEQLLLGDGRFEIVAEVVMGLVCFRLKGDNVLSERLLDEILKDGRLFLVPATTPKGTYFLRLAVCAERTISEDIRFSFDVIKTLADKVAKMQFPR